MLEQQLGAWVQCYCPAVARGLCWWIFYEAGAVATWLQIPRVLLLCAVLGLPVEFAERRSCCHGNFESCHCFPLCQQLWRSRSHWSRFFLGWNCSAVPRCLAGVEAGTRRGRLLFPAQTTGRAHKWQGTFGSSWVLGLLGNLVLFPGLVLLQQSPGGGFQRSSLLL